MLPSSVVFHSKLDYRNFNLSETAKVNRMTVTTTVFPNATTIHLKITEISENFSQLK